MSFVKYLLASAVVFLFAGCGNSADSKSPNFALKLDHKNNIYKNGDTVRLSLDNKKDLKLNSVTYKINGELVDSIFIINETKLGQQRLTASVVTADKTEILSTDLLIHNNKSPEVWKYRIINEYPHDITSYTQGLEFNGDTLYESTGQYGESKLRKINYENGEVTQNIDLSSDYFGEGLTILNDKLYQLTWQSNVGFVYDLATLKKLSSFSYGESTEGWGLANDGKILYKSDGTEKIYTLNPETLQEESKIEVYTNNGKIASLNELEWINGRLYANIYQRNGVAVIEPSSGAVEAVIDFTPLRKKVTQHQGLDVLNGIAYHPERNTIFVTGKRWDKLFEIEIIKP